MLDTAEWLSVSEAGRILDLTPDGVRYLIRRGQLPATRTALGRLVEASAVFLLARARRERRIIDPRGVEYWSKKRSKECRSN